MSGDNPSAFPFPEIRGADGCGIREGSDGMTLRDWFAGQALMGFLADGSQRHVNEALKQEPRFLDLGPSGRMSILNEQIASGCYGIADAMLAERSKGGDA